MFMLVKYHYKTKSLVSKKVAFSQKKKFKELEEFLSAIFAFPVSDKYNQTFQININNTF